MLGVDGHGGVVVLAHHDGVLAAHRGHVHEVGRLRVGQVLRVGLGHVVHAQVRLGRPRGSALARHVKVGGDVARRAHGRAGGAGLAVDVKLGIPVVIHPGAAIRRWFLCLGTAGGRRVLVHQLADVQRRRARGGDGGEEVGVAMRWDVERRDLSTEHDKPEDADGSGAKRRGSRTR